MRYGKQARASLLLFGGSPTVCQEFNNAKAGAVTVGIDV